MKLNHFVSTTQITSRAEIDEILAAAADFESRDKAGERLTDAAGKILATVFYEPSTRTRFSFETAMYKLGGNVITSESAAEFSSAKKGESIEDMARVVGGYADAIVLRHPESDMPSRAAAASPVPVINAGDGSKEHPTQALLDLYTMHKELGRIDDLMITFVGDLRYARGIHSSIYLLPFLKNVRLALVSPKELRLPEEYIAFLKEHNIQFQEMEDIKAAADGADVLSVTRIQKERFPSQDDYEKLKGSYTIDADVLGAMKKESIIMHPLPRVNEIALEVDGDGRAAYFRQARNGVYVRMAILKALL